MTGAPAPARRGAGNVEGALWMIGAALSFALQAVAVKTLTPRLDPVEVVFFRCAFGFVVTLPFALHPGIGGLRTRRLRLHVARGLIGALNMFAVFYALSHMLLAEATAISFSSPLFMIVLAVLFLGEPVHWRRWTATAVGFLGVLVVLRPGTEAFQPAALVALAGALMVATVGVLIKKLAATERPATILFYFGLVATLASAGPAALVWRTPSGEDWPLLAFVAVLGVLAQVCVIRAYRAGEATAVTPFAYAQLLFAGVFGFALFGEVPDAVAVAGAAIIVASTLYIVRREARLRRAALTRAHPESG